MAVDLSQVCSVVAHEIRTPVSVLQGYIRLLQNDRGADHPERALLDAMLDATTKMAAISRQASDLGRWLRGESPMQARSAVSVPDLAAAIAKTGARHTVSVADDAVVSLLPPGFDHAVVVSAFVALADAVAREVGSTAATVTISAGGDPSHALIEITSTPSPAFAKHRETAPPLGDSSWFAGGGVGLALVSAQCVLDAIGATVAPTGSSTTLHVLLPLAGGTA